MNRIGLFVLFVIFGLVAYANSPVPAPPADASPTRRGLVNTGSQTFGGLKTFVDGGVIADLRPGSSFNGQPFILQNLDGGSSISLSPESTYRGFSIMTESLGPIDLFLSPDGGDSSDCSIQRPCLTPWGAWSKLPRLVNHNVNISFAAGTYDYTQPDGGSPYTLMSDVTISPQANIRFFGPVTVLDTGTISYDGGTFPGLPILRDLSKNWTANQWKFAFARNILLDGGVGSTQPIISNTNTEIAVSATMVGIVQGGTFEIVTPGAVLTRSDMRGPILGFGRVNGTVLIDDLHIVNSNVSATSCSTSFTCSPFYIGGVSQTAAPGTQSFSSTSLSTGIFNIRRSRIQANSLGASNVVFVQGIQDLNITSSSLVALPASLGGNSSICITASNTNVSAVNNYCSAMRGYVNSSRSGNTVVSGGISEIENINPSGNALSLLAGSIGSIVSHRSICTTLGTNVDSVLVSDSRLLVSNLAVTNCLRGIRLMQNSYARNTLSTNVITFTNVQNAFVVTSFSILNLVDGLVPTFSTVTNEFVVDGASSTFSSYNSSSPKIVNGLLGSRIGAYTP